MRDNAKWHIRALEQAFDDRVRMMKEQESSFGVNKEVLCKSSRQLERELQTSIHMERNRLLQRKQNRLRQLRNQELLLRKEYLENIDSIDKLLEQGGVAVPNRRRRSSNTTTSSISFDDANLRANLPHPRTPMETETEPELYYQNIDDVALTMEDAAALSSVDASEEDETEKEEEGVLVPRESPDHDGESALSMHSEEEEEPDVLFQYHISQDGGSGVPAVEESAPHLHPSSEPKDPRFESWDEEYDHIEAIPIDHDIHSNASTASTTNNMLELVNSFE